MIQGVSSVTIARGDRKIYIGLVVIYKNVMVQNKVSKEECKESLQKASELVDGNVSQSKYRELDISPSHTTISNKFDGWNKAKEEAGLNINRSSKLEYQKKIPDILDIPKEEWESLSRNVRCRRRKQSMVAEIKESEGCNNCGIDISPVALDLHHTDKDDKFMDVSTMITQGYSYDRIRKEVEKCDILCANCHRIETSDGIYSNVK